MKRSHKDIVNLKNYQLPDKYGNWLGYKIIAIKRSHRQAKVGLHLREDHLSPAGRIHGGVISGLFDFACGAAVFGVMNPEDFCSTVEIKVNYFKPLNAGDRLVCQAKVVFQGKRLCVVHAYLHKQGMTDPVAMATATFNVVTKR